MTKQEHQTTFLRSIEKGIMALSPMRYSQAANTIKVLPAPQKSPIIVASLHGYFVPPHSRANKNMIANEANRKKPAGSSFESIARTVGLFVLFFLERSGILIARRKIDVTAPTGRLI